MAVGRVELVLPTEAELLRIKGVLILRRNATRDYLDFAALADRMGREAAVAALAEFDRLYPQENGESALQQLQVQLARPLPFDLEGTDLTPAARSAVARLGARGRGLRQHCRRSIPGAVTPRAEAHPEAGRPGCWLV